MNPFVQMGISIGISAGFSLLKKAAPRIPSAFGVPINLGVSTGLAFLAGHPDYEQIMAMSGGSAIIYDAIKNIGSGNHAIGAKKE